MSHLTGSLAEATVTRQEYSKGRLYADLNDLADTFVVYVAKQLDVVEGSGRYAQIIIDVAELIDDQFNTV